MSTPSGPPPLTPSLGRSSIRAILPALFLASSWTWVIGMWFPYYLTRDFGWVAWLVFAIPNVIGAASVGLILRPGASRDPATWGPRSSVKLTTQHDIACMAFSVVTIAFQLYVVSFLIRSHFSQLPIAAPMVSISTAVFAFLVILFALLPWRASWWAAGMVWAGLGRLRERLRADQRRSGGVLTAAGRRHRRRDR